MSRHLSLQMLVVGALGLGLLIVSPRVCLVQAAPGDVVELDKDTHHNPPATTPQSTNTKDSTKDASTRAEVPRKTTDDAAARRADAERLKLRAGEHIKGGPKGQAQVLGMALQEAPHDRVVVVDVGTASPAFDAGVRDGDEILEYQGFTADSYRKWIDGMQRLTTDAPAGTRIPIVVLRDGKEVTLRLRVPETPVRPPMTRTLAQQAVPGAAPGIGIPVPPPTGAPGAGNIAIGNSGPFGDFFAGESASANDRAMAEIVRLGGGVTAPGTTAPGTAVGQTPVGSNATASAAGRGMRIGLAGFRDDPSGMVVMVDVGALAPGNYTVGITDASVMGAGAGTAAPGVVPNPNVPPPSQLTPPVPAPPAGERGHFQPTNGTQPAAPARPAPAGVNQPQGSSQPRNALIPRTVLAQVASGNTGTTADGTTIPPTGQTRPLTTPPTGNVRPLTTPPTGQVNPMSTTPTGQSSVNNAQRAELEARNRAAAGPTDATAPNDAGLSPAVGGTMNKQIGTLTVDQSGTGRMQQTVAGTQVRDVVGQAIAIYSQGGMQTTLPANLNGNAGAATRQGVIDSARGSQITNAGQTTTGTKMPVAAGVIRLISDRRPPADSNATATTNTDININTPAPPVEQPASAAPAAGQNPIR